MRKLILGTLLYASLILLALPCTGQDKDSLHCIPMWRSRLLHADAAKKRELDTALVNRDKRVEDLENINQRQKRDFQTRLSIAEDKFTQEHDNRLDAEKTSKSFNDQLAYITKKEKKQRTQNKVLKGLATGAAIFIGYQAVK